MFRSLRSYCTCLALLCLFIFPAVLFAGTAPSEYRAWWVDGWGSPGFVQQSEVDQLLGVPGNATSLGDIRNANCNAVFVEVRRSADVAYVSGMNEPFMTGLTPTNYDALQAIIRAAHDTTGGKKRIEVHCWMVVFRTGGGTVYGRHDDTPTGSLTTLDNYWPTRTDAGAEEANKAFDPGHPLCEDYLTKVYLDIANNYDIDGVHYDYVRFTASNLGYNPTSVARYNARYGLTGSPVSTNSQWKQWRRDQISNLVRRIYNKMQILKPNVKVSGSFVTGAPGPSTPDRAGFIGTASLQPYNSYYQDWDSWVREGIVDMAVPMTYFDYGGTYQADWTKWINYEKDNHQNRQMIIGPGLYLNSLPNAITELQQTRTASTNGHYADGFSGYEYQEPYSSGTWSGWAPTFTSQITPTWADVPVQTWKTAPTTGSIQVNVVNGSAWVDGAIISGVVTPAVYTDGTGFYGFAQVTPGTYTITCDATAQGPGTQTKSCTVTAGQVSVVNFTWGTPTGISGYVKTSSGAPVVGASIAGGNGACVTATAADGSYSIPGMSAGSYSFKAWKTGYNSQTQSPISVTAGATTTVNFTIDPPGGTVSGYVKDALGHGVAGATVSTSTGGYSTTSLSDGSYSLGGVDAGTYSVTATMANYTTQTVNNVSVTAGQTTTVNFAINPNPPVITNVAATGITTTSATITWTTNVPATSQVEYGKTQTMGTLTTVDPTYVISHSVTLTGLTQNHIYHYRVTSVNSLGASATSARSFFFTSAPASGGATYIIDNLDSGFAILTGGTTWQTGTSSTDKYGSDYRFASTVTGSATATCSWTPNLASGGTYNVFVWYPQGTNRANNSPFIINYQGGSTTANVNQQANGGGWYQIGSALAFAAGTSGNVTLTNSAQSGKVVLADAVEFVSTGASDTTPPTVPTGLAANATSTSQNQLTWTASTDPSGIGGYKIYRNGSLIDAVDSGTTYTDTGLDPNTVYGYAVAAYDLYGNTSAQCSIVNTSTLSLPINVSCDKPTSTWQTASNVFTFTNAVGFGGVTIDHIRYVWDQAPSHTWTNTETSWTNGTQASTANPGGNNWYFHAKAYNPDNVANGQLDLGPFYCDTTPPTTPIVSAPRYTVATDQLSCTWTSSDPESYVVEYQYAIGTTSAGTNIKGWTSTGITAGATVTGLSLSLNQPYYFSVKARNGAGSGVWSNIASSAGTTPAHACASIADARALANGEAVVLTNRYVSYGASDGAFIQDPDKPAALYLPDVTTFAPGNIVDVGGILSTSGLLRSLTAPEPSTDTGTGTIKPYAMVCSNLGGAQLNTWTPGIPGSRGPNNLGMLVRVYGNVTSSTSSYFMMSDGSKEIQVQSNANPGSGHVIVTGISSSTIYNSQTIPMIIPRTTSDLIIF